MRSSSSSGDGLGTDRDTDDLMSSELLDLLQSVDDANTLSALSQIGADSRPYTESVTLTAAPRARHENAFLVGGSLFTRISGHARPSSATTVGTLPLDGALSPALMASLPARRRSAVLLSFGTLFCPFTRQFFALRSSHWEQLQRVGFGVSGNLRSGRDVELLYPGLLLRTAQAIQGAPAERTRTASWSPLLARTLGVLLRHAPVRSLDEFKDYIQEHLRTDAGVLQERQLPLSLFTDTQIATAAAEPAPADESTPEPRQDGEDVPTAPPDTDRRGASVAGARGTTAALISAGQAWLQRAGQSRRHQLQSVPPRSRTATAPALRITAPAVPATPPPSIFPLPSQGLAGLPPYTRVAWLRLPLSPHDGPASHDSLMHDACAALALQQMMPHAGADEDTNAQQTFFCPVHHAVDYNSVMDLVAYRVFPDPSAEPHAWLFPHPSGAQSDIVPVLSLGLFPSAARAASPDPEVHPSPRILLIVSHAHLLSRRAVSRMLDQWTRNGAAQRLRDERHLQRLDSTTTTRTDTAGMQQPAPGPRRFSWHRLLGLDPFASPIRRRYLMPFGHVRALFVALEPDLHPRLAEGHSPTPASAQAPFELSATASHSLFHLNEPLSATLLRIGPFFRARLDDEQRLAVLHLLTRRAQAQLPGALTLTGQDAVAAEARAPHRARHSSARLDSPAGARLFSAGCEALLLTSTEAPGHGSSVSSTITGGTESAVRLQSVERVIAAYPFLSSIVFSHHLVGAFPLTRGPPSGDGAHRAATVAAESDGSPSQWAGALSPVVVPSRQEAHARERRETTWRARQRRAAQLARASSSAAALPRGGPTDGASSRARTGAGEPYVYESFAEPALLLGTWTRTLLFCAPIVADVLPLRAHLLARVQQRLARASSMHTVVIRDVDVFHVDYIAFSLVRRCRLFGVRAWLSEERDAARAGDKATEQAHDPRTSRRTHRFVNDLLQNVLREYAADPLFFPLWTYTGGSPDAAPRADPAAATPASPSTAEPYRFSSVAEWRSPITPVAVERRLFAMASAQFPALQLAHGSRVALHSPVRCNSSVVLPAGTVCVVTDFVTLPTPATTAAAVLYGQQQRGGSLEVPVLRPLLVPRWPRRVDGCLAPVPAPVADFALLPQPLLVGGYRSVHYYALPLVHLPCHILAGGSATAYTASNFAKRPDARGERGGDLANDPPKPEDISFVFPGPFLFHPYYGTDTCKSVLCLTAAHRQAIFASLLFAMHPTEPTAITAPVFFEDTVTPSPSSCSPADGGAIASSLHKPVEDHTIWDPFLTELALFHTSPS